MAAPTNSRVSDMATENFSLSLSPLLSPRWSQLCLTPSPPQSFLPSSSSMVMQYQGSNQSMDDPPQNQEHDDIVDLAPYLATDSALLPLQQQLRKNWSEASSDWRPSGGGIMTMNNQGFEESNMGFEEFEEMMMSCFYFPPSPTNFPLYRPMPSVFFVSNEQENISLALSCQHILEDKSGALHVINGEDGEDISDLLFHGLKSYMDNKFGEHLDQIKRPAGVLPKGVESLMVNISEQKDYDKREVTLRRIKWLEQHDEDMVDQPFFKVECVVQQLIQNRGGELDVILGGGVLTINGLECRDGQGSPITPEPLVIRQAKGSFKVWLGQDGQWAAELRSMVNRLNIGSFTTMEDAISAYEVVARWSGWMDLTGFPGLFENENKSKLSLQLPRTAQELSPVEAVGTSSEGTGDYVIADQARLNSDCLGKRKTEEKNPGGERRSKKTNGVRIAIPLEDILQTNGMSLKEAANHLGVSQSSLKYACREYGISRWPPRKLMTQSHPTETPAVVDQEGIPQLNSDTLPSDQALAAPVEKITSVVIKEILPPPFSPTARQESLDEDFCNFEAEAVGIGSGGIGQSEMEEGQPNSRYLGKEKRKEMTPRGERRNKENSGVRIAMSLEEILQTKEMPLKDAAKHLKVSRSTFKRACREYGIERWPPRKERKLISQSHPNESVVDQERIPQSNSDTLLPSAQVSATIATNIVTIMARYGEARIKFQLSWPWRKVELKQQVKKRLPLEAGTYYIKYKDEDDGLTLIACDDV
ncbi:uncharacterized protein LOC131315521 isoform X2 [Rhododendron vialii]|uniref:uncharacterized protein LOC131315521 isoform X2 n=1 Tax=Rhododendron vialii TaxID=182163 RepID=UPI00265F60C8|nr:uncharacterized protein LOC131315521 isoform X2 [Rhododendron vialii]